MNFLSTDAPIGKFLMWAADIVILNVLWLICSIPIFTIGASTTALYYTIMKRTRRDEGYIYRNFFKAFKDNFRQSTIMWLIMLVIGAVLFFDFRIGMLLRENSGNPIGNVFMFISVMLSIPYTFVMIYLFPVQAKFENTIKDNFKNALLMAIGHFGYTLLLLVIIATFVILPLASNAFIGAELLFGMSLLSYLTGNVFIMIFRKHLPDELEEDLDAIGESKF